MSGKQLPRLILVGTIFILLLLGSPPATVQSQADLPPTTAPAVQRLRDLHKQRVVAFERAAALATQLYARGLGDFTTVLQSEDLVAEARVDAAESTEAKIEALKVAISSAVTLENLTKQRFNAGLTNDLDLALAQGHRLKLEIALLDAQVTVHAARGAIVTLNDASGRVASTRSGTALRQKAEARARAAEEVLVELQRQVDQGALPITPELIERRARWMRRTAEARIELTDDYAARLGVARDYVQACRDVLEQLKNRQQVDVSRVEVSEGAYHLADAEYLLAKLQSPDGGTPKTAD